MKNICIGLFEGEVLPESLAAFKDVKLDLEFGKITTIYTLNQMDCEKVVVVGLGDGKKNIKEAYSKVDADDYLAYVNEKTAYAAGFGLVYGAYSYKETKVYELECDSFKAEFEKGMMVARIVNHAREISDMPANYLTPDHLVDESKMIAEKYNMEIEVLAQEDLEEIGAGALLAVNQGSDRPCYMVVLRYDGGKEDEEYTALVGKGLTYDAGGYNIKSNMCGAANMLCALELIAELKIEKNIVCVLPITENKVNGHGFVDGDVITSLSGKTIEVTNTDAEGRLILAAAFLEEFIEEGTKWIHLDIAGTSDKEEVATGVMIETIVHFFENECK